MTSPVSPDPAVARSPSSAASPTAGLTPRAARLLCQRLRGEGISRAKIGGFDLDGVLRGKYVSLEKLESALVKGFGFCDVIFGWDITDELYDDAQVTGWHTGYPDAHARLDPSTERRIPWEPGVVAFLADFQTPDGRPHPACPRALLRRVREKAAGLGFEASFGAEFEFFLFQEDRQSLEDKGYRGLKPLDPGMMGYSWLRTGQDADLMREVHEGLSGFGVSLEGLHTETGPGVYEAAVAHAEVLSAADQAALFKSGLKQIVARRRISATFMAKPDERLPGASGHLHQSLWRDGRNLFASPAAAADGSGLSAHLSGYLAGLCHLLPALTALLSPTINSYKRYVPGLWAPLTASWGVDNRTCALRVIEPWGNSAARIECRQTAADINPYVAMAACLAAGLWGIEQGLQCSPPVQGDGTEVGPPLPRTLEQATERLADSAVLHELLGQHFVSHFAMTRRWEVQQYRRAVTDWERARYFELI